MTPAASLPTANAAAGPDQQARRRPGWQGIARVGAISALLIVLTAAGLPMTHSASSCFVLIALALVALMVPGWSRAVMTFAGAAALVVITLGVLAHAVRILGSPPDFGVGLHWRMSAGAAWAVVVLGLGTLEAAVHRGSTVGVEARWWLPVLAAGAMAALTLVMWLAIVEHDRRGRRAAVRQQAEAMAAELSRRSVDRASLVHRLTGRWANDPSPNFESWAFSTREWVNDYPGMMGLGWADRSYTERWSEPYDGTAFIRPGMRLDADPRSAEATNRATAAEAAQATAPIVTPERGIEVLLVAPIIRGGRTMGYLASALDVPRFLESVFGADVTRGYAFDVRDGDVVLLARQPDTPASVDEWQVTLPVTAMGRRWVLSVVPTEKILASTSSAIPTIFLALGLLWSMLLGWIVHVAQRSRALSEQLASLVVELADENSARRESERMREALVHSTLDAVAAFDAAGCVSAWNPRMAQLTGRAETEVDGQMIGEMVSFLPTGAEVPLLLDALAGRPTKLQDVLTTQADTGEEIWLDVSVTPMRSADGRTLGGLLVARDITERKRLNDVMLAGKLAAEEANRAKSDFLARMSHELRTPLNAVIGFTNVMRRNRHGRLAPDELTYLERINANGKHLLGLINEVLDLAKIEAGREAAVLAPAEIGQLVRDTIAELDERASSAGVRLTLELPAGELETHTDEAKLKQVLINLIGNAIKFTPANGRVTVRVDVDPATGRPSRIDVEDTGIGIPAERLDAIFEAFEQVDMDTSRRFGGTGLGLAISRKLCELMGHRLMVRSEVGAGSTFSVLLTAAQENQAAA